jgi:hypothetical protein
VLVVSGRPRCCFGTPLSRNRLCVDRSASGQGCPDATKLLDEGKFGSVSDLAREIGLDVSFAARLLRLTLLAPDIVEAILMGEEPSGLSLTKLTKELPPDWERQRNELGFADSQSFAVT